MLIQLEGCGVCASSLPVWEGRPWFEYPRPPGNPGHEGWGRVIARGKAVERVALGDRVAFLSDRAFAEYDTAPASSVKSASLGQISSALYEVGGEYRRNM